MLPKLGLIAGSGSLPGQLIERCLSSGRPLFVLAINGQADPSILDNVEHAWTRMGAADQAIKTLKNAGVVDLVMVGAIRRPSLAELRPDMRVARLFAKVGFRGLGDDRLLKLVRDELEGEGFRLVGIDELLEDLLTQPGNYGSHVPDEQALADIELGFKILDRLGVLDVGQGVVVQQGMVLGLEAIEGTNALIERCGDLRRDGTGGVLVKASKLKQERRIDLPTIGPETIEHAARAGLRGVALQAGRSLVVDKAAMVELADRLGLFITGMEHHRPETTPSPLIYLIAGEPSGDLIGARLMRALRTLTGGDIRFAGIGGEQMTGEGLHSLLPISGLAIMGVVEVLPAARRILHWVRETAADIERVLPDAVVTIDSSGFCFRVAERLKRKSKAPPIIHYVAPMVWAWRAKRAHNAVRAADHLLTLLPFEPAYFEPLGLPSTFVGHPAVEDEPASGDGVRFRQAHGLLPAGPLLCVLPGSRRSEVKRLLPIFKATVARLAAEIDGLETVIPTVETVADQVNAGVADWPTKIVVIRSVKDKKDAFAASTAALAASGTVSLELAVADVPMVIAYRFWPPTAWVLRRAIKVKYSTLVNILLDREVVPELMQEACTPERLRSALLPLLRDKAARDLQRASFSQAIGQLKIGTTAPSYAAAQTVLDLIAGQPAVRNDRGAA